jgi:hypothetical protein
MTPEDIHAAAVEHHGYEGSITAYTLARWATYGDPAELPPGWTARGHWTSDTGIQQMATDQRGHLYRDAAARRIPWTCSAGIEHRRYWRSFHHPNRAAMVACEHQPDAVPLYP